MRRNSDSGQRFQRLGQQRVIGIGKGLAGDRPGGGPVGGTFVDEQAHQFGDGDRRMRVVQLRGELLVQALARDTLDFQDAQHVLQRAAHEEELLLQAQLLALQVLVVRVQDLGEVLRRNLLVDRAVVITAVEGREIKGLGGLARTTAACSRC